MATYLELVPDNHILVIISLYASNAVRRYVPCRCGAYWTKLDCVIQLAKRKDSYEMKKYMMQEMPSDAMNDYCVADMLPTFITDNNLIGAQPMLEYCAMDGHNFHTAGIERVNGLQHAAYNGNVEMVELLLKHCKYSSQDLATASYLASQKGHSKISDDLNEFESCMISSQ